MSDTDVTVEQHGAHVGLVCLHRPPNNYFDTGLIEAVAAAYEELDALGVVPGHRAGVGGPALLRRARLRRQRRPGHRRAVPRAPCASSPPRSPWWPPCRVPPSAAAAGSRSRRTSGWRRRRAASAPTSPAWASTTASPLTVTLPAVVGRQAAADLLLTGRRVGGEEALALGLCDRLAGDGDVLAQALAYAGELAASGPLAVRAIRATLRRGLVEEVRLAMEHESAEQTRLRDTARLRRGHPGHGGAPRPRFPRRMSGREPAGPRAQHVLRLGRPRRALPRRHRRAGPPVRRAGVLRAGGRARAPPRWTR